MERINDAMTALQREKERIRFRQRLMSVPGGVDWLVHVARLFDHREQGLGPGDFGMPQALRVAMFKQFGG